MAKYYILIIFFSLFVCDRSDQKSEMYKMQREEMIKYQLIRRGIQNPDVIDAFRKVERHQFVAKKYRDEAYSDFPLPIEEGQTISQPYIVAFMTEAIAPDKKMNILEIGTGSGYQAAILAELCQTVYSIEIFSTLAQSAKKRVANLGYKNIYIRTGDGYLGWPEAAPFDAIIVTCAPSHIPKPLQEQLKEGGKMIIPVGDALSQELYLLRKVNGKIEKEEVLPVRFVPMIKENKQKY